MKREEKLQFATRFLAVLLLILTLVVSAPLTIRICRDGGGPWGFGIVGLHILLPLNTYVLFSLAGLLKNVRGRWWIFVAAHGVSVGVGLISFFIFPVLPKALLLIPLGLALLSIIGRKRFTLLLMVMLALGSAANVVLLKWEIEFGRTLPVIELFQSNQELDALYF
jgi:hypothetical protein